ncbi:prenyltransferase/squalene oxidase repeat-containing protein [uncultured Arcticibacterium sp.]|uniref:prenyltransferase/squalene oxidase repeat-containing protein n=1 Tax=uncultured Arcticibacterium sp. TaxID=2173042 RepID=UPI0030F54266
MNGIAKYNSLSNYLDSFWSELPVSLVSKAQLRRLRDRAHFFPPILRVGLECRLNEDTQVDLQQCLISGDNTVVLLEWLESQKIPDSEEWALFFDFFRMWLNNCNEYHKNIEEIFFEMDVFSEERNVPLMFFSLSKKSKNKNNAFLHNVLNGTLGKNRPFYPILDTCMICCPENAYIFFAGIQFSREVDVIRINIKNMYAGQVIPFLEAVGYRYETENIEDWVEFIFSVSDRVRLCLDLGASVCKKIGFECFWDDQPNKETRWAYFLDECVGKKICLQEKAKDVLAWEKEMFPSLLTNWPKPLWLESLRRSEEEFSYLKREVSHLKLSIKPSGKPELKAYLGYGNLWLNVNSDKNKGIVFSKAENIESAKEKGVQFLLESQLQSGFWIDFTLPAGKSDEWVTAYVGYYLSFFERESVKESLQRAWLILKKRCRTGSGFGYNVLTPGDADSTIWAYLFSNRLSKNDDLHLQGILKLYFKDDNGVTTYLERDKLQKLTKLGEKASFSGWQSPHLCVTAAYALSGNKVALSAILNNQNEDGSLKSYWWATDEYATALATEAMALDLGNNIEEIGRAVFWARGRIVNELDSSQPSPFKISLLLRILLFSENMSLDMVNITLGKDYLLSSQLNDGSWGSHANLQVPMPGTISPDSSENNWYVTDQNKVFTTVTILYALYRIKEV